MPGSSIESKLESISDLYNNWRFQENGHTLHHGSINRDTFGLTSLQVLPVGAWNKFNDTRVFMSLLEEIFKGDSYEATDITTDMASATRIANRCFSLLYRAGLFLTANEARTIGHLGVGFLQLYAKLAQKAISAGRLRFAMVPKVHYLMHCFLGLYKDSQRLEWCLSPLATSVQLDEDMIGRCARWSRRVGDSKNMLRTLGRFKISAWLSMTGQEECEARPK